MGPGEEGEVGQEGAGGGKATCRKTEDGRRLRRSSRKEGRGNRDGGTSRDCTRQQKVNGAEGMDEGPHNTEGWDSERLGDG